MASARAGAGSGVSAYSQLTATRPTSPGLAAAHQLRLAEFRVRLHRPYDARGAMLASQLGARYGLRWRAEAAYERHAPLAVTPPRPSGASNARSRPARKRDPPRRGGGAPPPRRRSAPPSRPRRGAGDLGSTTGSGADALAERTTVGRLSGAVDATRPFGARQLALRLHRRLRGRVGRRARAEGSSTRRPTSGRLPVPRVRGRARPTARVEWRAPVSVTSLPLARLRRTAATATLAPFAHAVYVARPAALGRGRGGWYPVRRRARSPSSTCCASTWRAGCANGRGPSRWTPRGRSGRLYAAPSRAVARRRAPFGRHG